MAVDYKAIKTLNSPSSNKLSSEIRCRGHNIKGKIILSIMLKVAQDYIVFCSKKL
jgi:hypothetical protein